MTNRKRIVYYLKQPIFLWTLFGILFGTSFPIIAYLIIINNGGIYLLFYIILTAPLFLGLSGYFVGIRQQFLHTINHNLKHLNAEQNLLINDQKFVLDRSSKLSQIGEMSSSVGHEISNPVTIIIMKIAQMKKSIITKDNLDKDYLLKEKFKI